MAVKQVLVTKFLFDIGVITDLEHKKQCQNGIRWAKRNLNLGDNLICMKRGVYMADEAKLQNAYKEHLKKCKVTSQKRKAVMERVNKGRADIQNQQDVNKTTPDSSTSSTPTIEGTSQNISDSSEQSSISRKAKKT